MPLLPSLYSRSNRNTSPWRALSQMEQEMERFLGERDWLTPETYSNMDFVPQCDIRETPKQYVIRFDVPGMKKEDIKIELAANRLTISGTRQEEKDESDEKQHMREASYGSFSRSFTLPSAVNDSDVDAEYKDGVLTVRVNKKDEEQRRQIEIH